MENYSFIQRKLDGMTEKISNLSSNWDEHVEEKQTKGTKICSLLQPIIIPYKPLKCQFRNASGYGCLENIPRSVFFRCIFSRIR